MAIIRGISSSKALLSLWERNTVLSRTNLDTDEKGRPC